MRRGLALAIVLLVTYLVVWSQGDQVGEIRATGLALGFALIAAALAGDLLERLRLPRVTGYLVFGLVCGPSLLDIITRPMARELSLFNGLTVALIAFTAGLEFNISRLRPRLASMIRLGATTLLFMWMAFFVAFWLSWSWLGIDGGLSGLPKLSVIAMLATLVTSFSPTVTIAIIAESRAAGPLSELTLALVILADLALIVFFTLSMQVVQWAFGLSGDGGLLPALVWEILGSFAFGAALGALFGLYLRHVGRELTVVLIALCVVLSELGDRLHFEPVLAALAAGLVVENQMADKGDNLKDAVEQGALPVLVVFFVAAGASLQLDALSTIGAVAMAIAVLRIGLIWAGLKAGSRLAPEPEPGAHLAWTGLVSQAGVTLGLTVIVAAEHPEWGGPVQTLMVALVALNQLVGPVLFRAGLARAGEIGRGENRGENRVRPYFHSDAAGNKV